MTAPSGRTGVWVIVVAAGSGRRFGGAKQFRELRGVRVLDRSVATAARRADGVVVVLPVDAQTAALPPAVAGVAIEAVAGGESRAESVRCGLAAVPDAADVILVHDAARPLATDELYRRVITAVRGGADAVVPAIPIVDTVRRRGGTTVDRSELVAVQTPQGFRADALRAAHAAGGDATDDATLVELDGGTVVLVDGDPHNLKLTDPLDFDVAGSILDLDGAGS